MGVTRVTVAFGRRGQWAFRALKSRPLFACSARMMIDTTVVGQAFAETQTDDACVHGERAEFFLGLVQSENRCRSVAGAFGGVGRIWGDAWVIGLRGPGRLIRRGSPT
jgi:hypothetical protein